MPPTHLVTQAPGLCFTDTGMVVMVCGDDLGWTFPGGTVDGETVAQALVREVAEEACAASCITSIWRAITSPTRSTPTAGPATTRPAGGARVALDPWQPRHETTARRLVPVDQVLDVLCWSRKEFAHRLLGLAVDVDRRDRAG